jgi:MoxR-like ATPase
LRLWRKTGERGQLTYRLPRPFFVIATLNPVELFGNSIAHSARQVSYKISIGYPSRRRSDGDTCERAAEGRPLHNEPAMDGDEVMKIRTVSSSVHVSDKINSLMNI